MTKYHDPDYKYETAEEMRARLRREFKAAYDERLEKEIAKWRAALIGQRIIAFKLGEDGPHTLFLDNDTILTFNVDLAGSYWVEVRDGIPDPTEAGRGLRKDAR